MKAQSSKSTLWRGLWILSIQSKAEKEMRCRAWRGGSWATRPDTAPERCCCQLSKLWKRSLILPKKHKYFLKCITGQNWERNSTSNQPTKVRLSLDAVKIFCACLKAQTSACNSSGWSFGCHLEEVQSSPLLTVQTHDYWLPPMVFHPLSVVCDRDESVMGLSVQVLSHESPLASRSPWQHSCGLQEQRAVLGDTPHSQITRTSGLVPDPSLVSFAHSFGSHSYTHGSQKTHCLFFLVQ